MDFPAAAVQRFFPESVASGSVALTVLVEHQPHERVRDAGLARAVRAPDIRHVREVDVQRMADHALEVFNGQVLDDEFHGFAPFGMDLDGLSPFIGRTEGRAS